mmetsp:Transcript_13255/g.28104  ORF Transcript_13255/g.28104 Transcript_13255/m.28104 type:complete len:321 (-) Transcript_13255:1839-2801(-)
MRCMTTLLVIPAFSAAATTSSIALLPDLPSNASKSCSPCFTRFSPADTTASSLRTLVISSTRACIVISPETIRLTWDNMVKAVSSDTESSTVSSCFSISLAAFRANGSNRAAVPPSLLANRTISSADISRCASRSTRVSSILSSARSRYKLFRDSIEIRLSLASLLFKLAASCNPDILNRKSVRSSSPKAESPVIDLSAPAIMPSRPPCASLRSSIADTRRERTASPSSIDFSRATATSPSVNALVSSNPPVPPSEKNIASTRLRSLAVPSMNTFTDRVDMSLPLMACHSDVFSLTCSKMELSAWSDPAASANESNIVPN